MTGILTSRALVAVGGLLAAGCSGMLTGSSSAQLIAVSPAGGAAAVAQTADLVLTFNRPMMPGMERYVALHQGGIGGPSVPLACAWSPDYRVLTCRPPAALAAGTRYALHVGGGMHDATGGYLGMQHCADTEGGRWATAGMMAGHPAMMGPGWRHPNGAYGMVFEFTTG